MFCFKFCSVINSNVLPKKEVWWKWHLPFYISVYIDTTSNLSQGTGLFYLLNKCVIFFPLCLFTICYLLLEYTAYFHFIMYNNACHILRYFLLHWYHSKYHHWENIYIYRSIYIATGNAMLNKMWFLLMKFIWQDLFSHIKSDRIILNICHTIIKFL